MKRFLILIFTGIGLTLSSFAQSTNLTGDVLGDQGSPLVSATVVLLNPKDSTLEFFGISNEKGHFEVKSIKGGSYLMQVAYLGYKSFYRNVTIPYGQNNDFGVVVLKPKPIDIKEVQVVGEYVPLTIRHDTIEFNARAFKTRSDANVEELLRKLPGIEVDRAGNIKALGKDVKKVLVDGKEFFGNDPKVATKNLPADAIDKVQLYDKKSDESEFTGIDDGTRDKTVNLVLKDDKKKGILGDITGGLGTGNHYMGSGKAYRFTDKIQAAALGMINNINQSGFSFGDYMSFQGGMANMAGGGGTFMIGGNDGLPVNFGKPESGLASSGAGGANFSYSWAKDRRVFASYVFAGSNRKLQEHSTTRNFTPERSFYEDQLINQIQRDTSHRINFGMRNRIDSTQTIIVNGNIGFSAGFSPQNSVTNAIGNDIPIYNLSRISTRKSHSVSGSASGSYLKKFNRNHSIFKISGDGSYSGSLSNSRYQNSTQYFIPASTLVISQFQNVTTGNLMVSGSTSLTQKLGGLFYIEPAIRIGANNDHYDRTQGLPLLNDQIIDSLSPDFRKKYQWLRPEVSLTRNTDKTQFTAALGMELGQVGTTLWQESPVLAKHLYFTPRLQWEHEYKTGRRLMLFYQTNVNTPSTSQLLPVVENSNPMSVSFGNRNLKPEYGNNIYFNWLIFDQFSFTSLMSSIDAGYTMNKINWSRTIDSQLKQTMTLVNVKDDYRVSGRIDFSTPIRKLGVKISTNLREGFNRGISIINGAENINTNFTHKVSLTVDNRKKDKWDVMAGGSVQITDARYSIQNTLNNRYMDMAWFAEMRYNPTEKWNFAFKADVTNYTAQSFNKPISIPLLSGEISYYFLKNNRGVLTLQGVDLLNKNTGIQRISELNYLQERQTNMLGRYLMLTFKYRLSKLGGKGGNTFDVKISR
ncbi:MAG: TonB-dependent receptor [Porphyromonadaceae bacterium]|nr:MAG: TonB-dependent receptor [Porphyromonadaceae bacterium]